MPSWLRVASLVGAIAVATSSSGTDAGPAQKQQPLLALVQDARDLSVAAPDVFQRAAAFGDVHALPSLTQPDSVPASSRQKRISRSAVDILVRRIGPSAGAGFMETVLAAQPPEGIGAIVIESGSFRLGDVRREHAANDQAALVSIDDYVFAVRLGILRISAPLQQAAGFLTIRG